MREIDFYITEHDEEEVIKRMKEDRRIQEEHELPLLKPYIEALRGVREVPRSEFDMVLDAAICANIESGVLNQKINEQNEIVVYRVEKNKLR